MQKDIIRKSKSSLTALRWLVCSTSEPFQNTTVLSRSPCAGSNVFPRAKGYVNWSGRQPWSIRRWQIYRSLCYRTEHQPMWAKSPSWRQYDPVQVIFTVCFLVFPTVAKTIMMMHTVIMHLDKMVKEIRSGYVLRWNHSLWLLLFTDCHGNPVKEL